MRSCTGLIVHSDEGNQYTAARFRVLLAQHGATQIMSRRGNCYDYAQADSFWSRHKTELLDGGSFPGLQEARLELSHCIAYYNDELQPSALGYLVSNHFETRLQTPSDKCQT